ncbi:MAG: tyrosine-type recombinase/integrase [Candidatus Marinimicrobia bacterium]|nr:tyrosine-type recombinase/integrase [Candidatus Neomarinimicrobiota bacterium]
MASLRRLRNKYYARINYKDEQSNKREKLVDLQTSRKEIAEDLMIEVNRKEKLFKIGVISIDEITTQKPTSLSEIIQEFYEYLKISERSKKTIELYKLALNHFQNIFDGQELKYLTREDSYKLVKGMKKEYSSNTTCNIRLRSVRAFLNWCFKTGKIDTVPFTIETLSTKKKRPRYFTDKEMTEILKGCLNDVELYTRVFLHWKTGMRLREIQHSYLIPGFIEIIDPCKNGEERTIPVDKETALNYELAKAGTYHPTTISAKFREVLDDLELRFTESGDRRNFHCLRNTFAVRKYFESRDIFSVMKLLGHSSVKVTEKYADYNLKKLEQDFDLDAPVTNFNPTVKKPENP